MGEERVSGPYLVLPTRRCSVPYLTSDQIRKILQDDEKFLCVSIFDAEEFVEPCTLSQDGVAKFSGLDEFKVFLTTRSSFHGLHSSASSSDASISGVHERGRVVVKCREWDRTTSAVQPFIAVAMHDSVALCEPPSRKRRVSVSRGETWQREVHPPHGCTMMSAFSVSHHGGYIDSLCRNESWREYSQNLRSLNSRMSSSQAPEGISSMCCAPHFVAVLAALKANVTWIESPLPFLLAEKGVALTFSLDTKLNSRAIQEDLNNHRFKCDLSPLQPSCQCYTCQRHHKAYVHHLLSVQEMNSSILLSIHNVSMMIGLVRAYRQGSDTERAGLLAMLGAQARF